MCLHLQYWQVKGSLSNEAACLNRPKFSFNEVASVCVCVCMYVLSDSFKSVMHYNYFNYKSKCNVLVSPEKREPMIHQLTPGDRRT